MDEEKGLVSPISGGVRAIRRNISSNMFVPRRRNEPQKPDPVTTNLLTTQSLQLRNVSRQLELISNTMVGINSSLNGVKESLALSQQLENQREQAKRNRDRQLAEQGLREGKESALEKKIQFALQSPLKRVAAKAQGVLFSFQKFFLFLAGGWLTNVGIDLINALVTGNTDLINKLKLKFTVGLVAIGTAFTAFNVGFKLILFSLRNFVTVLTKLAFGGIIRTTFNGFRLLLKNVAIRAGLFRAAPVGFFGGNSGALAGTDTVTVTAASKTYFPGYQNGQFLNDFAFSAPTNAGKVISWGNSTKGGDSSSVSSHLTTVSKIYSNSSAFAAVKDNGSVVSWGNPDAGGTSWDADGLSVNASLSGSGNLTLSGASTSGGSASFTKPNKITITSVGDDSTKKFTVTGTDAGGSALQEEITGKNAGTAEGTKLFKTVTQISVDGATTGNVSAGNLFSPTYAIATDINGTKKVTKISSTADAFAAVRDDGSVITWGSSSYGGDSSSVSSALASDVIKILGTERAFAALKNDGSVVVWGKSGEGGSFDANTAGSTSTMSNNTLSSGVLDVFATEEGFTAVKSDGIILWGKYKNYYEMH